MTTRKTKVQLGRESRAKAAADKALRKAAAAAEAQDYRAAKRNIKIISASIVLGLATGGGALAAIGLTVSGGIISGIVGTSTALITNNQLSKV